MADHFQNSQWLGSDGSDHMKMYNPNQFTQPQQTPPPNQPMAGQNTAANGFDRNMWAPGDGQPWSAVGHKMAPPIQHPPSNFGGTFPAAPANAFPVQPPWQAGEASAMNGPPAGSQFDANTMYASPPTAAITSPSQYGAPSWDNAGYMMQQVNNSPIGDSTGKSRQYSGGDPVSSNITSQMEEITLNDSSASSGPHQEPQILPASNSFSNLQHQPSPFDALGSSTAPVDPAAQFPSHQYPVHQQASSLFPSQPMAGHSRNSSVGGVQFIVGSNSSSTSPSTSHSPTGQIEGQGLELSQGSVTAPAPGSIPPQGNMYPGMEQRPGIGSEPPSGTIPEPPQTFSPERPASVASSSSHKDPTRPSSVQSSASAEVANLMQPLAWQGNQHQPIPEMQASTVDPGLITGGKGVTPPTNPQPTGVTPPHSVNSPPMGNQASPAPPPLGPPLSGTSGQSPAVPPHLGPPQGASSPSSGNPFRKGTLRSPYTPPQYTSGSQSTGTGSSAQGFQSSPISAPFSAGPVNIQAHTEVNPHVAEAPSNQQGVNAAIPTPASSLVTPEDAQPSSGSQVSHNMDIYASPIVPHPEGPFKPPTPRDDLTRHEKVDNNPAAVVNTSMSDNRRHIHAGLSDNTGHSHAGLSDNTGHSHAGLSDNTGHSHAGLSDNTGHGHAGLSDNTGHGHAGLSDNTGHGHAGLSDNTGHGHAGLSDNTGHGHAGLRDNTAQSHGGVIDNREQEKPVPMLPGESVQTPEEFKTSPFYQQQKESETRQSTFSPPLTLWEEPAQGHPRAGGIHLAPVSGQLPAAVVPSEMMIHHNMTSPMSGQTFQQSPSQEMPVMPGIVPLSNTQNAESTGVTQVTTQHATHSIGEPLRSPDTSTSSSINASVPETLRQDQRHSQVEEHSSRQLGHPNADQGQPSVQAPPTLHQTIPNHPQVSPQSPSSSVQSLPSPGQVLDRQSSVDTSITGQVHGAPDSSQVQAPVNPLTAQVQGPISQTPGQGQVSVSQTPGQVQGLLGFVPGQVQGSVSYTPGQEQISKSSVLVGHQPVVSEHSPLHQPQISTETSQAQAELRSQDGMPIPFNVQHPASKLPGQVQESVSQIPGQRQGSVNQFPGQVQGSTTYTIAQVQGSTSQLPEQVQGPVGQLTGHVQGPASHIPGQVEESASQIPGQMQGSSSHLQGSSNQLPGQVQGSASQLPGQVQGSASQLPGQVQGSSNQLPGQIQGSASQLQGSASQLPGQVQGQASQLPGQVQGSTHQLPGQVQGSTNQLPGQVQGSESYTPGQVQGSKSLLPGQVQGSLNQSPGQSADEISGYSTSESSGQIHAGLPQNTVRQNSTDVTPPHHQTLGSPLNSAPQQETNTVQTIASPLQNPGGNALANPGPTNPSQNQLITPVQNSQPPANPVSAPMQSAMTPGMHQLITPVHSQPPANPVSAPVQSAVTTGMHQTTGPETSSYSQQLPKQGIPLQSADLQPNMNNPTQSHNNAATTVSDELTPQSQLPNQTGVPASAPRAPQVANQPTEAHSQEVKPANSVPSGVSTNTSTSVGHSTGNSGSMSAFSAPDTQHRRNESHDSLTEEYNRSVRTQGAEEYDRRTEDARTRDQRGGYSRDEYYRYDRRYEGRSDYYSQHDSYNPYGDQRYDPRYDPYRDPNYDQRYDPHRPSSRQGHGEYPEQQERSRARARQSHTEVDRYGRDSSRHGREDRARSTSRSRYEGERPHSRQGYDYSGYTDRPRSRHGYEEYDYSKDKRYDHYYDRGHYEGYDDRYHRDRYQRGYESEMRNYQGHQQYYDQYGSHHYAQQQQDYYSRHGYYPQHSYDNSSYDDRHSTHSRGSTPGFDHPAYANNSGADHFAREFHQGSRPSSRASATYEQSPIYSAQDATRHGYYEQSYDQSYIGYNQHSEPQQVTEPEPARRTPHKHTIPHVRASFAPNGHLIRVLANQPQDGQPATVEITEASGVCEAVHADELKLFPGPLIKGETHKNDVLRFCQNKVRELDSCVGMIDRESAQLLWRYLELLIKQNGTVVGTDLADLLMEGHEQSTHNLPLSGSAAPMETSDVTQSEGHVTSDRVLVSQDARTTALDRFRQLCLFGRKKEALEFAMKSGLWEQALFLAQRMGPRISASVYTRFMNSALSVNDPLRTMYQLMSGRQPAACTMVAEERFGDWRPHLAIVLSHPSDKPDIHHKSVVTMGDSFASKGYLYASQICYLLAGCTFQDFSKKTAKLVLLGANHSSSLEEFATNTAIQCTEIYEYAMSLAKPVFCLPSLQVFKYLYTTRLLDTGMVEEALHYCEVLANTLTQKPGVYSQTLVQQVAELGDRLKGHDPQRLQTDQELPDPGWLTNIQNIAQQYQNGLIQHTALSSGSQTPAGGVDTRSSSEVAEILSSANQMQAMQEGYTQQQQIDGEGNAFVQGYSMDSQLTQQQQTQAWNTTQQLPGDQPVGNQPTSDQQLVANQTAGGQQPLELWNAATGTWTYADPSATYQQPQQLGEEGAGGQWGYSTSAATAGYTQDQPQTGFQTESLPQDGNQSYLNPSEHQSTPAQNQYGGQEVLQSVPEHQDAEGGGQTFDYYGQTNGASHYSQHKPPLPNGTVRRKTSESSDSASDSETDSSDSASTVNDVSQNVLPQQQAPPPVYNHLPPRVYSGYKAIATNGATWPGPSEPLPDIAEASPTDTLTPTTSPRLQGVFDFGVPPPPSSLYRASDPSTPLGAVEEKQETESSQEVDASGKKKTYWPGEEDEAESKKIMEAAKKTDPKTAEKPKSGEGIFSRIFGIGKKNKNEMKLPDDKKKPIVWDADKKAWVDTTSDGSDANQSTAAPPPKDTDFARKMSMPATMSTANVPNTEESAPQGGPNRFSRGKMPRGARSQYVDVLKGKAKPAATAPSSLFNVLPKSQSVPANIFIPSATGVSAMFTPVADAAIDHHAHKSTQPDTSQTDNQSTSQPDNTATDQDNLSRSSSQSSLATEVQYYLQQPKPPQAANQPDSTQNYYQQNYDYSQSQNSYQQQAPPTQDFSQSQKGFEQEAPPTQDMSQSQPQAQSFGQSQSAFKQPAPPAQGSGQSAATSMPQFFNPASITAQPQMGGGPSRLSRYGQGRGRPQYPKQ